MSTPAPSDSQPPAAAAPDASAAAAAAEQPAQPTNAPPADSNLISEDGELSDAFYAILRTVFLRYAKRPGSEHLSAKDAEVLGLGSEAVMGREQLNAFARTTNGSDLEDASFDEIVEYLDVTDKKELTFKGFTQLYTLQTQNDHSETVHDLESWGYDAATLKPLEKGAVPAKKAEEGEKKAEEKKEEA
ncbi:hypothetical protein JCM10207_001824 [Rhodosporidiobolus poonsookiae]